jgi:parvulin-like peptidyl-prolyl isomerase
MDRRLLAGVVGLAFIGCAQQRSLFSRQEPATSRPLPPPDGESPAPANGRQAAALPTAEAPPPPPLELPAPPALETPTAETTGPGLPPSAEPFSASAGTARTPKLDPAVRQVAHEETSVRSRIDPGKLLGLNIATVGGEAISKHELEQAYREWHRQNVMPGQVIAPDVKDEVIGNLLEELINRSLLTQEAKRKFLKSDKAQKAFNEFADKRFEEDEVPKLVRKFKVENRRALIEALEKQGRSLRAVQEDYRRDSLEREFLFGHLGSRLKPSPTDLEKFYQAHMKDFDRPARVTWREIVIKAPKEETRVAARQKAEAALARLRRGDDFAAVARSTSEGPTAARGGLWQTEPKASATPAVNVALDTQPLNQTSQILEGPAGFHIVRVEGRRPAGPAPFTEVQEEIVKRCIDETFLRERLAYLDELRAQTIIRRWKDDPPAADAGARRTGR